MKRLIATTLSLFILGNIFSQVTSDKIVAATIFNGDTIPFITLREVTIVSWKPFRTAAEEQAYKRLINNVKRVYPYAKVAAARMKHYDKLAQQASSSREKKRINKMAEDDIKAQFENDIRNMTQSQGALLIKIIDRETGKSSYEIISDTRGRFRAVFWQSFSFFWGVDLKQQYDPYGEDRDVETIINMIDSGLL